MNNLSIDELVAKLIREENLSEEEIADMYSIKLEYVLKAASKLRS